MRTTTCFVAAALIAAGCIEPGESVGSVGAALTATDSSGATYRLPAGTRLMFMSSTYFDGHDLDGDAAVLHIDLPVGDYQAWLSHEYGYTNEWPLERTDSDGSIRMVTGYLITPMPQALTIFPDTTTSLVLTFQVPEFGDITFAEGTLDVSTEIEQTTAGGVDVSAFGAFHTDYVAVNADAPPALAGRLPALGEATDLSLSATVTGAWAKASASSACAPAQLTVIGSGQAGVVDLLVEVNGSVRICVYDGAPQTLQIVASRYGVPSTATFADLSNEQLSFMVNLIVELPAPVFDGSTLDLDPVTGEHTAPAFGALYVGGSIGNWYFAGFSGPYGGFSVTLTP